MTKPENHLCRFHEAYDARIKNLERLHGWLIVGIASMIVYFLSASIAVVK